MPATRKKRTLRPRSPRPLAQASHPARSRKAGFFHQMPVRALMVGAGVVGLAGLALAAFGPKRFANEIALPLRDRAVAVVTPSAGKLWNEFQGTLDSIKSEAARARVLRAFQSWLERFRSA